jgi:glycosyltransferase involved in cell wall biosynthesis
MLQAHRVVAGLVSIGYAFQPDVVVTNTAVIPAGARAARRLGVPHVWIVRESIRDNPQLRSLLPKRSIARKILRTSAVVCPVSAYVLDQLTALAGEEPRIAHIVSPNPASQATQDATSPASDRPRTILMPGFYSREKGQLLVVLGAWRARRRGHVPHIRIVGRGSRSFTRLLTVLIRMLRLHEVELLPWSDNLQQEYERAHFVLSASRNEAFGRTVVEAFSYARPVIGFARGATTMLLESGGGILIDDPTSRGVATGIACASTMTAEQYAVLSERAFERGRTFAEGDSQYQALRVALRALEDGPEPDIGCE